MEETREVWADDVLDSLTYYTINMAHSLLEFNTKYKEYMLDAELTKEQKRLIKEEIGLSSRTMRYMSDASKLFKSLERTMELVVSEVEKNKEPATWDSRQQSTNHLIATMLIYIDKCARYPEAEERIREFILNYGTPTDGVIKRMYRHYIKIADNITRVRLKTR